MKQRVPNKGAIRDPGQKKARALLMLEQKIKHAATTQEIATEFNVSTDTVKRTLSWAKKAQLSVQIEDRILDELMPLAHKAIALALNDEEAAPIERAKIALELYKGMVPGFGKKVVATSSSASEEETLASYVNQFRTGLGVIDAESAGISGNEPGQLAAIAPDSAPVLALPAGDPASDFGGANESTSGTFASAEALLVAEINAAPPGDPLDGASSPTGGKKPVGQRVRKRASVARK